MHPTYDKLKTIFEDGSGTVPAGEPIVLKNDIAALDPKPIAKGAFGSVFFGKILNPIGLIAERVLRGEENPRWLGLDSLPYEENAPEPRPIKDAATKIQVNLAARRLWTEYLERRAQDPKKANEEFVDLLNLIDPHLIEERTVAVKVLRPASGQDGESDSELTRDFVRRFIQENEILRRLRHPNIVRRFGLVHDPLLGWCMLLEFVDGETLDDFIRRQPAGRVAPPVAARMARDLAAAVEYCQEQGVIHRDLKPSNIMIRGDDGRLVLMDFGIGKWVDDSDTQPLTMPGARVGTPRYMAPEQVMDGASVTRATDIYQLSTVLFEMITGRPAYENIDLPSMIQWLREPGRGHLAYVRDHLPELSPELERLIEVGRDKDPAQRWTVREFREQLDRILSEERFNGGPPPEVPDPDRALHEARMRRKSARWDERVLEMRIEFESLQRRIRQIRDLSGRGARVEAISKIDPLRQELLELPERCTPLLQELRTLEREIEHLQMRDAIGRLVAAAEGAFGARRFPDVGTILDSVLDQLKTVPPDLFADLRQRCRAISEQYDRHHRAFVELFNTLRASFLRKIEERVLDLKRLRDEGRPLPDAQVGEVLAQIAQAESSLSAMDRDKIGPPYYDGAREELARARARLDGLRA